MPMKYITLTKEFNTSSLKNIKLIISSYKYFLFILCLEVAVLSTINRKYITKAS